MPIWSLNDADPHIRAAVDAIAAIRYVHSADLSPDGMQVAYCVSSSDDEREDITLFIADLTTGNHIEAVRGGRNHSPSWSPDGTRLAFLKEENTGTELALLDISTSLFEIVKTQPQGPGEAVRWSPDGRMIAYVSAPPARDVSRPYRVTRATVFGDGLGLIDDAATDIYVLDVGTGESRRLTDDGFLNRQPSWDATTDTLVYIAIHDPDDWADNSKLRRVTLDGVVTDLHEADDISDLASFDDGIAILRAGVAPPHIGSIECIGANGAAVNRTHALDIDIGGDVIGDMPVGYAGAGGRIFVRGDEVLARVHKRDRLEIHAVALSGEPRSRVVVAGDFCAYPLALAGNRLLYAQGTLLEPPHLRVLDLYSGMVHIVAEPEKPAIGEIEVAPFSAGIEGGPAVQTWFLRPRHAAGPVPTVLLVHGGPVSAYGEAFFADAALLCEGGLGVILANPRGSRGYGPDHATAIQGKWGDIDYREFMAVVDTAIERGFADPNRLGVAGVSYGGYMTAWIISQTRRFKAAVAENCVSNFWSLHYSSDVGRAFVPELMGGTSRDVFSRYIASSPLTFMHSATTPTLVIQALEDRRCPLEQGLQLYHALKEAGCESELLLVPDVAHDGTTSGPPVARLAQNEALLSWMLRHL